MTGGSGARWERFQESSRRNRGQKKKRAIQSSERNNAPVETQNGRVEARVELKGTQFLREEKGKKSTSKTPARLGRSHFILFGTKKKELAGDCWN